MRRTELSSGANAPPPSAFWICEGCGGGADDETALDEHQEWCLGDPAENVDLLREVGERDGELTHEALVGGARHRRLAAGRK